MTIRIALLASAFSLLASSAALAGAVDVLVGDKDGFGVGCSDTGTCATVLTAPTTDERSAAEAAATNGAENTDVYSAVISLFGPNPDIADIILPFSGALTSATLTFAAGDFQTDVFGALTANINGVSEPFSYADGRLVTAIHSIVLSPAELAAANSTGFVDLHLDRSTSGDFIAFDYFEFIGTNNIEGVPEPITLSLFGAGLVGAAALRRRKKSTA
ncbi:MAG: PEP-CTERM sorting domain-containing protein [Rhizomicrobium sp.]